MPRKPKTGAASGPPSSIELFLLAMAQAGLSTTYELQKETGLSVGATVKTIGDLEGRGWLAVEAGTRTFKITEKGRRELESRKEELKRTGRVPVQSVLRPPQLTSLDTVFGRTANLSLDSSLRILFFLWLWQPSTLRHYAGSTGEDWQYRHDENIGLADHIWKEIQMYRRRGDWRSALPKMYRWMKLQSDAALFEAQGNAIRKLAELIEQVESPE